MVAANTMTQDGDQRKLLYCSPVSKQDNDILWGTANAGFNGYDFRVIGYAFTFPGAVTLIPSNANPSLLAQTVTDPTTRVTYQVGPLSDRPLLADATISKPGQYNEVNRGNNQYTGIQGGWVELHNTAHLDGRLPAGGNIAMMDTHVEWRKFGNMHVRTQGGSPVFWW